MQLEMLLENISCDIVGNIKQEIDGLSYDSRSVKPGDLFFCIRGFQTDGHKFAPAAITAGAICLVVEEVLDVSVPQVVVADSRKAMALISAAFYGYPAKDIMMLGVTGTSGKTSTTYMLKSILEQAGKKVGLIGTISNQVGEKELTASHTTPESLDLHKLLRQMIDEGLDTVVMEVSSHSLALDRVYGIEFEGAIYTNLSQDHLDFHKDFTEYKEAKSLLFCHAKHCAINMDDAYAVYMMGCASGYVQTYGIEKPADVMAKHIEVSPTGSRFVMTAKGTQLPIVLGTPGRFMVYNALAAITLCFMLEIDMLFIKQGLEAVKSVPGRVEALDVHGGDYSILLDYSHKPDSLEKVLKTVRDFADGRVVCIFGCGGNRDTLKRPIMGAIAERLADFTIVTSDNPRFEEPMAIIEEILAGMEEDNHIVIENRRDAILYALENVQPKDVIVLAGKGHETYQEIKGVKYPFDEKIVVEELLCELGR